jgi:hypothetical protein
MAQALWFLLGLGLGLALDFLLVKVMLRSVEEKVLALESARVMERLNLLESELRWQMAKAQALELDLERANQKLSVKAKETVQELLKEKGLEQVQK